MDGATEFKYNEETDFLSCKGQGIVEIEDRLRPEETQPLKRESFCHETASRNVRDLQCWIFMCQTEVFTSGTQQKSGTTVQGCVICLIHNQWDINMLTPNKKN